MKLLTNFHQQRLDEYIYRKNNYLYIVRVGGVCGPSSFSYVSLSLFPENLWADTYVLITQGGAIIVLCLWLLKTTLRHWLVPLVP